MHYQNANQVFILIQAKVEIIIPNPIAREYSEENRWHSLKLLYPLYLSVSEYCEAAKGWIKMLLD